jgi:hypothetical protein
MERGQQWKSVADEKEVIIYLTQLLVATSAIVQQTWVTGHEKSSA